MQRPGFKCAPRLFAACLVVVVAFQSFRHCFTAIKATPPPQKKEKKKIYVHTAVLYVLIKNGSEVPDSVAGLHPE